MELTVENDGNLEEFRGTLVGSLEGVIDSVFVSTSVFCVVAQTSTACQLAWSTRENDAEEGYEDGGRGRIESYQKRRASRRVGVAPGVRV